MRPILISALGLAISCAAILFGKQRFINEQVIEVNIVSESLKGNQAEEESERSLIIYLPPGYNEEDSKKYPCIYYLHGFTSSNKEFYSLNIEKLMNEAILSGALPPCIAVFPDSYNSFYGSFYTNSVVTGLWADYISNDVVAYMDKNYRTIPEANQRILTGHSMGGNGALKIAMNHPEVFGLVYALSPSALGWSEDFTIDNPSFELISKTEKQEDFKNDFYSMVFMAMGRSYSANTKSKYMVDLPVQYKSGQRWIDSATLNIWNKELPLNMASERLRNLKQMKAIGIEYGINDEFAHIPTTCNKFKEKLDSAGIACTLIKFEGKHYDQMAGDNGRIVKGLFSFIKTNL